MLQSAYNYINIYCRGDNASLDEIQGWRLHLSEIIRNTIFSMSLYYGEREKKK